MREPDFDVSWPESWKFSYAYDREEVFGKPVHHGYAYAYSQRQRIALQAVQKVASPPATVLDVAAAQGNFSLLLAEDGYRVTWNDLRSDLVDYVRLKHETGTIDFVPGNVLEASFDSLFDVVLITEVIEHVAHPDQFLAKIATLLKPNGHVVMTTPNGAYVLNRQPKFSECPDPSQYEAVQFRPNSDGHIFLLHDDEVRALSEQAGLKLLDLRYYANVITSGHLKTSPLTRALGRRNVEVIESFTCRSPHWIQRKLHAGMAAIFQKCAS